MNRIAIPLAVVLGLVLVVAGIWWFQRLDDLATRIQTTLPEDRGLAEHPEKIEARDQIRVTIKQEIDEGVPHFIMFGQDIRADLVSGVKRLPSPPPKGSGEEMEAFSLRRERHWARYVQPKIDELKKKIDASLAEDPTLPCQIESGPHVRHEYVIAVLDAFMEVCLRHGVEKPEITFSGSPPPQPR